MKPEKVGKSLQEKNKIALQEFLEYRKQKEAKERLQEALAYYEDAYDEYEDEDDGDNRKYRYG